jgi:UDP-N-acetylmuramate dehydrogenase
VILHVTYALRHDGPPSLAYADLKKYFTNREHPPTLTAVREAVRQIRASKSMLLTPGDEDCRSAGSFFKNPVLTPAQFDELKRRAAARNLEVPSYPALEAQKKVSAAWLVEHSGFSKGYQRGRVGLSRKHALAIVNRNGATAAEIVELKHEIQRRVREEWGILLEVEPVMVGF